MEASYQVFISASSKEYTFANTVFDSLANAKITAYFCERSIPAEGNGNYIRSVMSALQVAQHLVVVACNTSYLHTEWLKTERELFFCKLLTGVGVGNIVIVSFGNIDPKTLPFELRRHQILHQDDLDQLPRFVGNPNFEWKHPSSRPAAEQQTAEEPRFRATTGDADRNHKGTTNNTTNNDQILKLIVRANALTSWLQANIARAITSRTTSLIDRTLELDLRFLLLHGLFLFLCSQHFTQEFPDGTLLGRALAPFVGSVVGIFGTLFTAITPILFRRKILGLFGRTELENIQRIIIFWAASTVSAYPLLIMYFLFF